MRVVVSTGWFAMWGTLAVILSAPACSAPKAAPSEAPPTIASPARASAATPSEAPSPSTAGSQTPAATTAAAIRYVAIGASDSVGVGASDPARGSWPSRVAALLPAGAVYMNVGVAGSLALQAEREQLPGAIAQHPTLVTVWLAVNDLNATIEPASFADALGQIVDGLVAKTSATIFVGDVPDLRAVPVYVQRRDRRYRGATSDPGRGRRSLHRKRRARLVRDRFQ